MVVVSLKNVKEINSSLLNVCDTMLSFPTFVLKEVQ